MPMKCLLQYSKASVTAVAKRIIIHGSADSRIDPRKSGLFIRRKTKIPTNSNDKSPSGNNKSSEFKTGEETKLLNLTDWFGSHEPFYQ
jgi:hypothetical protein